MWIILFVSALTRRLQINELLLAEEQSVQNLFVGQKSIISPS